MLALAESEFDVFIAVDKSMPYQQELDRFDLLFVLLHAKSNAVISEAASAPATIHKITRIGSATAG